MDFGAKKSCIEVIKEHAFGGTYFRDIYSSVNGKSTESHGKNSMNWKILIKSIIVQIIMMSVLMSMVLNAEHR